MIALRHVLILVEDEACSEEEQKEISEKIEKLDEAILLSMGEDAELTHPLIGKGGE